MSKVLKHSHGCACPVASVMFDSLRPFRLQPTRFLCPWAFSRQEYWSGLQWPPPGDLPNQRIESGSLASPPLAGGFFAHWATWEAQAFTPHTHTHTHTHTNTHTRYTGQFKWSRVLISIQYQVLQILIHFSLSLLKWNIYTLYYTEIWAVVHFCKLK